MQEVEILCRDCNQVLTSSGKSKERTKRCNICSMKSKPGRYLGAKLRSQKRKHGPIPEDEMEFYTNESAQAVYDLYERKSFLSGESDLNDLCIATKVKKPKSRDDLILLTTKEATAMARKKTDEEMMAFLEANKMKIF
jgi:predicted PolB exonuclease-like 3'-5' exonuclease